MTDPMQRGRIGVILGREITPLTPELRCRAEDLIYEAWQVAGERRVSLARKALALWPDCADGYVLLAQASRVLRRRVSCLSAVSPPVSARWGGACLWRTPVISG
jgi:hypothetical protein